MKLKPSLRRLAAQLGFAVAISILYMPFTAAEPGVFERFPEEASEETNPEWERDAAPAFAPETEAMPAEPVMEEQYAPEPAPAQALQEEPVQIAENSEPAPDPQPAYVPPAAPTYPDVTSPRSSGDEEKQYIIRTGDRVNVKIFPEDDYVKGGEMTIGDDGNVRITTAGKVQVVGLTIAQAENKIIQVLLEYFVDPEVTIEILDTEERTVVILGQVQKPGTYPMPVGKNNITLMEAIAMAGGFSEIANIDKITITRKTSDGQSLRIRASAEDIIQGREEDIKLQTNDIVHVKESFF